METNHVTINKTHYNLTTFELTRIDIDELKILPEDLPKFQRDLSDICVKFLKRYLNEKESDSLNERQF